MEMIYLTMKQVSLLINSDTEAKCLQTSLKAQNPYLSYCDQYKNQISEFHDQQSIFFFFGNWTNSLKMYTEKIPAEETV